MNTSISLLFWIKEIVVTINKNIVVVFIPPAVLAGDPPINIKKTVKIVEDSVNPVWFIEENPAVLVVTDWKNEFVILSKKLKFFKVFELEYSKMKNAIVPKISNPKVITKTILVCKEYFLKLNLKLFISI